MSLVVKDKKLIYIKLKNKFPHASDSMHACMHACIFRCSYGRDSVVSKQTIEITLWRFAGSTRKAFAVAVAAIADAVAVPAGAAACTAVAGSRVLGL